MVRYLPYLMSSSRRQSEVDLERIVDEPLECGQSTNHGYSDWKAVPETGETDVAINSRHCFSCRLTSCLNVLVSQSFQGMKEGGIGLPFLSLFNLLTITSAG